MRLANDNVTYNTIFDHYQIAFDAMPSYQEKINQDTANFYQNNNAYFGSFNQFVKTTLLSAANAEKLTVASIFVGVIAVMVSYYSIAKDERWNKNSFMFLTILGGITALMVNYIYPEYSWSALISLATYAISLSVLFRFNQNKKSKREQAKRQREQQREFAEQQRQREIEERYKNTV